MPDFCKNEFERMCSCASNISSPIRMRSGFGKRPAKLNSLSTGAELARTTKYFLASVARWVLELDRSQYSIGSTASLSGADSRYVLTMVSAGSFFSPRCFTPDKKLCVSSLQSWLLVCRGIVSISTLPKRGFLSQPWQ